jgi:hypothetical protein
MVRGMGRWKIVGGPREYGATPEASDIAVWWAWDLECGGRRRTVRVEIVDAAASRFGFADAERALGDVLDWSEPPERLLLTLSGVQRL